VKPVYRIRDFVHPKPDDPRFDESKPGMIMEIYNFEGRDRYVVGFPDGRDGVFFDSELDPAELPD
jgi:hypothetical protein